MTILDAEVKMARKQDQQKHDVSIFQEIKPYGKPVDGSELLTELVESILDHVIIPLECAVATALWIVLTFVFDEFRVLPILAIESPEKRCGKTTLLSLVQGLASKYPCF